MCVGTAACYDGPGRESFGPDPGADDGEDGSADEGGNDGGDEPIPPSQPLCSGDAHDVPGPRLLRRLTVAEYELSVRHALALDEASWGGPTLSPDPAASTGYTNDAERLRVGEAHAAALETNAIQLANLVSTPERLATLLPCANEGGLGCAEQLLDGPARRLFRRTLRDEERARYLALLDEVEAQGGQFEDWVQWTVQTLLQSPHFVYRSELGEASEQDEGWYDLSGPEVATLLAFALTGAPPDDALLDRAEAGELDTPEAIAAVAAELAFDASGSARPKLRQRLQEFHRQWLGLSTLPNLQKDPERYPGFSDEVKASMAAEIEAFVDDVVFGEQGDVTTLLTADHSHVDATLAAYYGYGDGAGATAKPPGWGVGLLSLGGVMATHSTYLATSPTQRGKLVRSRLLCTELPPPPPDVGELPPPEATQTTRQRYEEHVADPSCAGCHTFIDPIGFGLEGLDASGRHRSAENGFALDLSGLVENLDGETVTFEGATELAEALAGAETPALCMSAHMATFALGLSPEQTECIVGGPAAALAAGDMGIAQTYVAFAETPHFWRRQNR
ncbi:MAG: DUF1592 domain-containing protein [Myxococcota bacterium]